MSRHRNIRRLNYDEEYDGYDDVYSRSVEDDSYCVSPGTAHFMFDRNAGPHAMAAFFPTENIPEEEDDDGKELNEKLPVKKQDSLDNHFPDLNPIDEVRLRSCLDEIHNIVGDTFREKTLIDAVIASGFNLERALDAILKSSAPTASPEPVKEKVDSRLDVSKATVKAEKLTKELKNGDSIANGESVVQANPFSAKKLVVPSMQTSDVSKSSSPFKELNLDQTLDTSVNKLDDDTMAADISKLALLDTNDSISKESTPLRATKGREANKVNAEEEYRKQRAGSKVLLNLVVIGHVDAGKSTLMGHVLWLLGAVSKKVMHKYEQESKKIGKSSFVYAWVLDETGEERSRGVTMDVGYSNFETPSKAVTLLDAPGHKDFIPNMITGAAQADVAILVVDATRGEFETGFESGGQTREHALLVRSLGVSQLLVAINKLDTVNWSKDRYEEIVKKLSQFLKQAGFKEVDVTYIPCSGLTGENLVEPVREELLKEWYSGPTLLQQIDMFRSPERSISKPFRLCVSDVFKSQGSGFSVSGKVETGFVQNGDKVLVMPLGEQATIKGICVDSDPQTGAFAGDQVVLSLSNIDMVNINIGCVICDSTQPIRTATRFRARIIVFNIDVPITKGFQAVLHYQSLSEPVVLKKLISQLHKSSGEAIKKKPRCLTKQSNAIVELEVGRPICVELYKDIKEFGRFMLRSAGSTVAAGLVTEII